MQKISTTDLGSEKRLFYMLKIIIIALITDILEIRNNFAVTNNDINKLNLKFKFICTKIRFRINKYNKRFFYLIPDKYPNRQ